jgi:hypothetical protein
MCYIIVSMPTDTPVTSLQHLDAMEAQFVALNNLPFKKIIE